MLIMCLNSGMSKWSDIAAKIPGRTRKQCKERWFGHLDPNLKQEEWSSSEDAILLGQYAKCGTFVL